VDTQSNEESGTCPSTPGQLTLARMLVDELKTIGIIRDGESEHQAANQAHSGWYRRFTAFLYGAANTAYFHRRRKLPRQVRIYFSRQQVKRNVRKNVKEATVLRFEFNPEVKLLLVNQSNEKVTIVYDGHSWPMPEIGWRPPYYTNLRYGFNYPIA